MPMYPETGNNDAKVYVGNLPSDTRLRDLEDIFYKFGKIRDIDLHDNRNPPFAFVEFEDARDAEDAVYSRDGYDFDGYRIRVEFPRSSNRGRGGPTRSRGGGGRGGGRGYVRRGAKGYKCVVNGLPPTGSWQDLKDHFRECGDVIFTDVNRDGSGIVEFSRQEHVKRAIRDLNDSKFRSHEGETAYINVREGRRSYSRSRSRSPRRSRSPSPRRRTKSRSRSPVRRRSSRSYSR